MRSVLVTGASGFIGRALVPALIERGYQVRAAVRDSASLAVLPKGAAGFMTGELESFTDWRPLLTGIDLVVHLAGLAHRPALSGQERSLSAVNISVARAAALASAQVGVRRFVYLSSVKAMGEETPRGEAWTEAAPLRPADAYGRSKREAELALAELAAKERLELAVLRCPLVYGPRPKGNIARLAAAVRAGLPLPVAGIDNRRSLVSTGNLAEAIALCLEKPAAAGQTFLVSDGEDLSTPELVRRLARALGRPARLFPFPPRLLRLLAAAAGRGEEAGKLVGSLALDIAKIRRVLGYAPPLTVDQGLAEMARSLE